MEDLGTGNTPPVVHHKAMMVVLVEIFKYLNQVKQSWFWFNWNTGHGGNGGAILSNTPICGNFQVAYIYITR